MPIKIPDNLPTSEILKNENIFIMEESRAFHQDIRPLKIVILNLMPTKQDTEVQILRLIGNTPLQIDIRLMHMESHISKNTSQEYLSTYYNTFDDIKHQKFDGMIITGAPVEHLIFEDVTYWKELTKVMEWTKSNVTSTFHICWAAQAALYYHYGINKYPLPEKVSGVYRHTKNNTKSQLLRGFDDIFFAPHSRYTEVRREDLEKIKEIEILSESSECGIYIASSCDGKQIFVTGHSEYDCDTLKKEYERDLSRLLSADIPTNYFPENNPNLTPVITWRAHANLLYSNWLNYYVYQETPYAM